MSGRGHCQLWPKRGKFLVDNWFADMVHLWCILAPKRITHYISHVAGDGGGTNGDRDHTLRRPQCTDMRTARCARRIDCNSGGGLWAGQHNRSLTSKEVVQRGELLDVAYEKGKPAGDGVRVLYTCHKQSQRF